MLHINFGKKQSLPIILLEIVAFFLVFFMMASCQKNSIDNKIDNYLEQWSKEESVVTDIYINYFQYNEGSEIEAEKVLRVIEGVNKINELDIELVPYTNFEAGSVQKIEDVNMNSTYNVKYTITENPGHIVGVYIRENRNF